MPGAGWITFDPTNRSVGGFNLIPVAVARDIRQAMPVAGSFMGLTVPFWVWGWRCLSRHRCSGRLATSSNGLLLLFTLSGKHAI